MPFLYQIGIRTNIEYFTQLYNQEISKNQKDSG